MKHLTRYLKGYEKQLWLGPLFKLAEAILELFVPWIVADLIDNGIAKQDFSYVLSRGGLLFVLAAVGFAWCANILPRYVHTALGRACGRRCLSA